MRDGAVNFDSENHPSPQSSPLKGEGNFVNFPFVDDVSTL